MLAHVNHVQPKVDLPLVRPQKHSNAMPHRSPKTTQRNLTGLYLGVEDGNQRPQRQNALPMRSRGRGMPSRRIRTPTEERRYKKVEMLRSGGDRRGFSGNPVKPFQARGLASTDEVTRANMYPTDSDQFWDVTRQTTRQFTAPPNSGVKHLEYLNPDPDDIISTYYPRAFDKSLDEVLVQEIQKAVSLKKEVAGLVHCYNKICKGNTRALQSLLPNRGLNSNRSATCLKTGFCIKSYQSPRQAEIDANFPKVQQRPKTVVGTMSDRPLVPSPYFFKLFNTPKTAGHRPTSIEQDHKILAAPGAGCLSQSLNKKQSTNADLVQESPVTIKMTTLVAEDLIPLSPKAPCATPVHHNSKSTDPSTASLAGGKVNVTLPAAEKSSSQVDEHSLNNDNLTTAAAKNNTDNDTGEIAPAEKTSTNDDKNKDGETNPAQTEVTSAEPICDEKETELTAVPNEPAESPPENPSKEGQGTANDALHKDDENIITNPDQDNNPEGNSTQLNKDTEGEAGSLKVECIEHDSKSDDNPST